MTRRRTPNGLSLAERVRFYRRIEPNGCHVWTGNLDSGYGTIRVNRKTIGAHRASWIAFKGAIPDGMEVCHSCDTPACVNPEHLFVGSHADNVADMLAKGRGVALSRERHANSKLTERNVAEIRNSSEPARVFAQKFQVSRETINAVRRGATWKEPSTASTERKL